MTWPLFFQSDLFRWVILPLLIFSSRILDVSLGTIRIIFISRGLRYLAPIVGFFEVLIWLVAISQIFQHLNNTLYYIAYAGGFSCGTLVGMVIENRLAMGVSLVRIITAGEAGRLIQGLRRAGQGITSVDARGGRQPVKLIFTVVQRKQIRQVVQIIRDFDPHAFYTIEDVRFVNPANVFSRGSRVPAPLRHWFKPDCDA